MPVSTKYLLSGSDDHTLEMFILRPGQFAARNIAWLIRVALDCFPELPCIARKYAITCGFAEAQCVFSQLLPNIRADCDLHYLSYEACLYEGPA